MLFFDGRIFEKLSVVVKILLLSVTITFINHYHLCLRQD